ncbi:SDR family NAD(P)-dependent oxidoreductase [Bradyrhizobium sp. PMVTL-01]|uniref:SDR family NAD(P)-dependent oxidoreductase n=1 Tax=Bradyrhizobium sp. PMVTL-01 TaxID=3434999 RepID=UPI003F703981
MRNVVVTGGSRGIGLAIARRLAASRDYDVIALARREGELPSRKRNDACTSAPATSR